MTIDKNLKLTDIELTDIRNTVEYVTSGRQKMYPMGFFSHEKGSLYLIECVRHYVYTIKGMTEDDLMKNYGLTLLREIGLINGLKVVYGHRTASFFLDLFPNKHIWDMSVIPIGEWTDEIAKEFATWYLEEHHGLTQDTIDDIDWKKVTKERSLKGTTLARNINKFNSILTLVMTVYPNLDEKATEIMLRKKRYEK